jgi:hypothetical protein
LQGPEKTKIVLMVAEKELRQQYLDQFKAYDLDMTVVDSVVEMERQLSQDAYNGIVIDLKTKLMAPRGHKELAYEMLEHYPVLQCRILPDSGKLQIMPFGKAKNIVSLESFLKEICTGFDARKLRASQRKAAHFNVLLSRSGAFTPDDVERAFTVNISKGGCFIATCSKWNLGGNAAFILKELTQRTPIVGEIRWQIAWGQKMQIPGIGLRFEDIAAEQIEELKDKFRI